jgi:hypothetical protein
MTLAPFKNLNVHQLGLETADTEERIHSKVDLLARTASKRTAEVVVPFQDATTITGTATLAVWTPTPGFRFLLKGFDVTILIAADIAAAAPVTFGFWDGTVANGPIAPLTAFQDNDPEGLMFSVQREFHNGIRSGAANRPLVIAPNADIGAGVVHVFGIAWGDHVEP